MGLFFVEYLLKLMVVFNGSLCAVLGLLVFFRLGVMLFAFRIFILATFQSCTLSFSYFACAMLVSLRIVLVSLSL